MATCSASSPCKFAYCTNCPAGYVTGSYKGCPTNSHGTTSRKCRCSDASHHHDDDIDLTTTPTRRVGSFVVLHPEYKCQHPTCSTITFNDYCYDHVCKYARCQLPRIEGSDYCSGHTPASYCSYNFCMLLRVTNPDLFTEFCERHQPCAQPGCILFKSSHSCYCHRHQRCIYPSCTNIRSRTHPFLLYCKRHKREAEEAEHLAKHYTPTLGVRHEIVKARSEARKRTRQIKRKLKF